MLAKLKKLGSNDGTLFTISNLIFSFSTYLIALIIPYRFDIKMMADFSATLNIVMILAFVFEFGLATSYLRFNQLYKTTQYINAYFQFLILLLLFLFYSTFLGDYLGGFLGFENVSLNNGYLYLSIFAILSWMFFKNIYLSSKKIKFILFNAIVLLFIRVGFLIFIFMREDAPTLDEIFLYLFVFPFVLIAFFNLKNNIVYLKKSFQQIGEKRNIAIFKKRFKKLIVFSGFSYIIGTLYVYTSRYVLVFLTEKDMTEVLAELGYAFSFGGLIMVFMVSMRLYFISKFNISDVEAIKIYIKKIGHYKYHFFTATILVSLAISSAVWVIKPEYLSMRSIYFLFMLIFSYSCIMYFSMITLLSKTFDFSKIELVLNIIRLGLVMLSVQLLMETSPLLGFAFFSANMVLIEFIFARIVLNKILKKEVS